MSTSPVYLDLSSNIKYAINQTKLSIEKAIQGEPNHPFYPNLNENRQLSRDVRFAVGIYEELANYEGEKVKKAVKEGDINSVLYNFNQSLFKIAENAKKEGIWLKKQYEAKKEADDQDYCRIKGLEEEVAKKEVSSDQMSDWESMMTTMKAEMEKKMEEMFQDMKIKFESAQEEVKKTQNNEDRKENSEKEEYLNKIDEMENELADQDVQLERLKNKIEWYKKNEGKLVYKLEEKSAEVTKLNYTINKIYKEDWEVIRRVEELRKKLVKSENLLKNTVELHEKEAKEWKEKEWEMGGKQRETDYELGRVKMELKEVKDALKSMDPEEEFAYFF
uniref:Viral A-type inclusion protein n=1 Tax=Caenorhabditis tropicalis TaxID=1561998 RepID=A0A1I7UH34_9PELO